MIEPCFRPMRCATLPHLVWCIALVVLCLAGATTSPFARVVVMGASVSDGFGVRLRATLPDGRRPTATVSLCTVLQAACTDKQSQFHDLSTDMYFLDPAGTAQRTAAEAIAKKPTLVLAIDWLFWNGYGVRGLRDAPLVTCEDRLALLDHALQQLQPLAAQGIPIVLGDFPDMHTAIGGGMLSEEMVPSADCVSQLNVRVQAWCATRPNVALMKLSEVVQCAVNKTPVTVCGRTWNEAELGPLMQSDRLHPTLNGSILILAVALESADRVTGGTTTPAVQMDPGPLRAKLLDGIKAAAPKNAPPTTDSKVPALPPSAERSQSLQSP